ncbi:hypothetical protein B0920_04495 [Massilia sp. KIM]|uniref:putative quinol monooxygenase n=1 Tax=Massilia sp. KIM TaxID=1955422 RepID=UPI0009901029|nr:putative quinol monooxygenase [Massilia sp. KIM]OON62708.1 hypothetical protein B0920_04495 [Massilia sp. KIM]
MSVEVIATLEARPDRKAEVEAALSVLVRQSRQEPGVRRYDLYRDSARPASFYLIEAYMDEAALEAHRGSAHCLRFREQAGDLLLGAPRVAVLEAVELVPEEFA